MINPLSVPREIAQLKLGDLKSYDDQKLEELCGILEIDTTQDIIVESHEIQDSIKYDDLVCIVNKFKEKHTNIEDIKINVDVCYDSVDVTVDVYKKQNVPRKELIQNIWSWISVCKTMQTRQRTIKKT